MDEVPIKTGNRLRAANSWRSMREDVGIISGPTGTTSAGLWEIVKQDHSGDTCLDC